jgi:hypothetical protein
MKYLVTYFYFYREISYDLKFYNQKLMANFFAKRSLPLLVGFQASAFWLLVFLSSSKNLVAVSLEDMTDSDEGEVTEEYVFSKLISIMQTSGGSAMSESTCTRALGSCDNLFVVLV